MSEPVAEALAAALTYPSFEFTSFYRHDDRVNAVFVGNIGAVTEATHTSDHSQSAEGEVNAVLAKAKTNFETSHGVQLKVDIKDPLAHALVLREFLTQKGSLSDNPRFAREQQPLLARGHGAVLDPDPHAGGLDEIWRPGLEQLLPPEVATDVIRYHALRVGVHRDDDSHPEYRPAVSLTPKGPVVALLGGREFLWNEWGPYSVDMPPAICSIFGTKLRNYEGWTLVSPLHVWREPDPERT